MDHHKPHATNILSTAENREWDLNDRHRNEDMY